MLDALFMAPCPAGDMATIATDNITITIPITDAIALAIIGPVAALIISAKPPALLFTSASRCCNHTTGNLIFNQGIRECFLNRFSC